jgi:hypothetical protein
MNDRGLGGAIYQRRRKTREPPCDAAIVDDAAGALFAHMGGCVFHAEHHAAHQCRHRGVEAVNLKPLDAAGLRRAAGVVEQAIDAAEFVDRGADQRAHLILLRDIGLKEHAAGAELFGERLALRRAAACDHDFRTLGDEDLRRL